MKKKVILSIVAAAAVVAVGGVLAFSHVKAADKDLDLKETNKLKVYVYKDDGYMNYLLEQFNQYYTDVNVEKVTFDNAEQFDSMIKKDANKKGGPDVIIDDTGNSIDLRKMQMNNELVDLKPLLKQDKDFVFEDYNDAVFNSCAYDGKLTAVPMSYTVPAFFAGEKTFDGNLLKQGYCLKDLVDTAVNSGKDKKTIFSSKNYISQMIASCGYEFIDYKNKKLINEDKLKEVMDYSKKLYSKDLENMNSMKSQVDGIKDKSVLFVNPYSGASIVASTECDSAYKQFAGDNARVYAMPSLQGGTKYTSVALGPMCIPENAVNKQSALDFIKFCLSSPVQNELWQSSNIAVRIEDYIEGFKSGRQHMISQESITDANGKETSEQLQLATISDNLYKSTKEIINKSKKCRYIDNASYKYIFGGINKYITSDVSKEQALSEIKDELNKYFKN